MTPPRIARDIAVHYREAGESDLPAICALGMQVNALHHDAFPRHFAPPADPGRDSAHWAASLAQPMATTFVAELASGPLAGFITVAVQDENHTLLQPMRIGRIGTVGVTAEWRGHGMGRALMQRAQDWVLARGATELRLHVWAFNEPARRLYEELGYELRMLTLAKPLAPAAAPG
jgi:ribosomal protein S18 acetylase RimI-like enzyme